MSFKKLFVLLTLLVAAGCSDAPSNYPGALDAPKVNPIDLQGSAPQAQKIPKKIVESPDFFKKPDAFGSDEGSVEEQKLKDQNLNKPIVYGIGAAGITMDTTYAESKKLLTKPFRGPFDDGLTFYNEQVIVYWKLEGERKPQIIIPIKGYMGQLDAGKFGVISLLHKFTEYKAEKEVGATKLTRDLYNEFEKVKDPSKFDCFKVGRCRMIWGTEDQANFVVILPGAVFLMAKEEFQMAEVRIIRDIDPGVLSNNIDLLTGKVLLPENKTISLGDTYESVFKTIADSGIQSNPEVYVRTDFVGYSWNGFWMSFKRSNFSVAATKAESSDVVKTIELGTQFMMYPTVSGKRILMKQSSTDVSFSLEQATDSNQDLDDVALSATEVQSKLKMSTVILKNNAPLFVQRFSDFLAKELAKNYENVDVRVSGDKNPNKQFNDISASIVAFNTKDSKALEVAFQVSQEQEKLAFINMQLIGSDIVSFDRFILPSITTGNEVKKVEVEAPVVNVITGQPVLGADGNPVMQKQLVPYYSELSGVALNDLVKLTAVDNLGRSEANIEMISANSTVATAMNWTKAADLSKPDRVGYVEQGTYMIPEDNRPVPRAQSVVAVGSQTIALGLQEISKPGSAERLARVVSVETARFNKVSGVCGIGTLSFTPNSYDEDVLVQLRGAIDTMKQKDAAYNCNHFTVVDSGSKGALRQIYFPDDRLVINFNNRALSSISIYLPLSEVDKSLPEVQ